MVGLNDETLIAWMVSPTLEDFLGCESTLYLVGDAIATVAGMDHANLDVALEDAFTSWSRSVQALRTPHPADPRTRWQRYASAACAALALGAVARIGDPEPFSFDLIAARGSLGLHGMSIVNQPEKLAEFTAHPCPVLESELADARSTLDAMRAVHARRASPVLEPDGSWWAWYALYEPAARAAAATAATAWDIARAHDLFS